MPERDERPIERLLKSAKSERLAQAGRSEMHPATREMLHTEARKHYPRNEGNRKSAYRWWLGLLPKVAVFVALGAGVWLLVVREDRSIPPQLAMKRSPVTSAYVHDVASDSPASSATGRNDESERTVPLDKVVSLAVAPQSRELSPSAVERNNLRLQTRPAELPKTKASGGSVVGPEYFKAEPESMYIGTAAMLSQQSSSSVSSEQYAMETLIETQPASLPTATLGDRSRSIVRGQGQLFQKFSVAKEANQIRIVDADGSVYSGQTVSRPAEAAKTRSATGSSNPTILPQRPALQAGEVQNPDESMVSFGIVVSGTNRSLNQPIQFTGNLSLREDQLNSASNWFENVAGSTTPGALVVIGTNSSSRATSRLVGRAFLEDGTSLPVEAVRSEH